MSVAETFLKGGRPSLSPDALAKTMTAPYQSWCWVMALPRQWHRDRHTNTTTAPAFHFLFGANSAVQTTDGKDSASPETHSWRLLFATVQLDCSKDTDVLRTIESVFCQVPTPFHPQSFSFIAHAKGLTHTRLGLFQQDRCAWIAARLADKVLSAPPSTPAAAAGAWGHIPVSTNVKAFAAAHVQSRGEGDATTVWKHHYSGGSWKGVNQERSTAGEENSDVAGAHPWWLFYGSDPDARTAFVSSPARLSLLVEQTANWFCRTSGLEGCRDDSYPSQGDNTALLETAVRHSSPLLWQTRYTEPATVSRRIARLAGQVRDLSSLTGVARLRAERDEGREALRAAIGESATFVIPSTEAGEASDKDSDKDDDRANATEAKLSDGGLHAENFRYVFYLQRPHVEKRPIDMDNRDPGPLSPQPIGAEIHLLPDPGDALYMADQISGNSGAVVFNIEDFIPDEGEVLVQLGPVEGVAFDDLDRLLDTVDACHRNSNSSSTNSGNDGGDNGSGGGCRMSARPVLCEGSCSGLVFPRVLFRQPTGRSEKLNPMTRVHAELIVLPPTSAMLHLAARTIALLSTHTVDIEAKHHTSMSNRTVPTAKVTAGAGEAGRAGYTLTGLEAIDPRVLGPASRRCGWCARRRERLLRCAGCKAAFYCNKSHQALDWREGTHKGDCGLLRCGASVEAAVFDPLAATMPADVKARRTPGWSCAGSLVELLSHHGIFPFVGTNESTLLDRAAVGDHAVHVVGIENSWVPDFAAELARRLPAPAAATTDTGTNEEPLQQREQQQRLQMTIFVEQAQNSGGPDDAAGSKASPSPRIPNNTIFALFPPGDTAVGARESNLACVVDVPSTGVLGDIWHLQGDLDAATAPATASRPAECGDHHSRPFSAARAAPVLLRVCQQSYFRYVDGAPSDASQLDNLLAVLYVGPASGAGLGYLYGSLDTVARAVAARAAPFRGLRFLDSSLMGSYKTVGALLARMDERRDAAGLAVRNELTRRWKAVATAAKKAKPKLPVEGATGEAAVEDLPVLDLIKCSTNCFGVSAIAEDESAAVAKYVNSFYFDVPAAPADT